MKKSQGGGFLWFLLMMKNIPNLFNPQCLKHLLLISGRYCLVKSKGNNFAMHITKIIIYIYTHTHRYIINITQYCVLRYNEINF